MYVILVPGAAVANHDRIPAGNWIDSVHRSIERIMSCISPTLRIPAAQAPYLAAGCCWSWAQPSSSRAGRCQTPAQALPGTSWALSSLNGQLPLPGAGITLDLGADGSATGTDGCNRYSTAYTVNASSISFDPPATTTMMACAEPVAQQADDYRQALAATDTYKLQGSQLALLKGRQVLATFVSAAQEPGRDGLASDWLQQWPPGGRQRNAWQHDLGSIRREWPGHRQRRLQ